MRKKNYNPINNTRHFLILCKGMGKNLIVLQPLFLVLAESIVFAICLNLAFRFFFLSFYLPKGGMRVNIWVGVNKKSLKTSVGYCTHKQIVI